MGDRSTPIKAEIGVRYQLFDEGKLYFAYHHKTLWDINNGSSPVLDSNYNPSIFYHFGLFYQWRVNLGIIEHLSNGQVDEKSRGINMSFIQFMRNFSFDKATVDIGAKFFVSYKIDNGSADIVDYEGIWKALIRINNFLSFINFNHSFEVRLSPGGKWGTKFSNGNVEFGLKTRPIKNAHFSFYLQYFTGRNEYLLDYKVYHQYGRIGIEFDI